MKKRLLLVLLISVGLLTLVGCGKKEETKESFEITFDGVNITPGETIDASIFKKEYHKSEEPDCAFGGKGINYTFDELEVSTNEAGKVYSVYIMDPNVGTKEGVYLGDEVSKVTKAYGDKEIKDNLLVYKKGHVEIDFNIDRDVVEGIEYRYVEE